MCSVAWLSGPHADAQRAHVARSRAAFVDMFDFTVPADLEPAEYARRAESRARSLPFTIRPLEGWAGDGDPFCLARTFHDVVPRELLRADGARPPHSGNDVICREVARGLRQRLDEYGVLARVRDRENPLHEHFLVRERMAVQVVNIVHTSYCTTAAADAPEPSASAAPILFTSAFLWRRLAFLGCQENHTYTSLKISYKPPFKASQLFFASGRVLETGSSNEDVSHAMFFDATLEYLRAAGMPRVRCQRRASQNVVAKSCMPDGQQLLLELLQTRMVGQVTYEPQSFAGAVIRVENLPKVVMLAFPVGSIVCVGPTDIPSMRSAFDALYDTLQNNVDSAHNRAVFERFAGKQAPRKRRREDADAEEHGRPLGVVRR